MAAQITPPGFERERKELESQHRGSILDRTNVVVLDTAVIIDPETRTETMKVVTDTLSWRAYIEGRLGVQNADQLLDGKPRKVIDPVSYEEIMIQWNRTRSKLDTLPN